MEYNTRSNYSNILIARMAYLIIFSLPNLLNMLNFDFSYAFYLTERTRNEVYASIKVLQDLEKTTRSSAPLQLLEASTFIAGDIVTAKVNIDCCLVFVVSIF